MEVRKEEVEALLNCEISDEQFAKALVMAKKKQAYLLAKEKHNYISMHYYLVTLIEEYVISNAMSRLTMDLCRAYQDMEKEHPFKEQGTPPTNHILTASV